MDASVPIDRPMRHVSGAGWEPGDPDAPLLVADSWLVADGRVRAAREHWARFAVGCAGTGLAANAFDGFPRAVAAAVPAAGRWFPRVEVAGEPGDPVLQFRLRAAPPPSTSLIAWVPDEPDPRRHPRVKGPDLGRLGRLRRRAVDAGADEAMLLDLDGCVLEGAYASLLWWEDDTLWTVPDHAPVLPGVTRGLVLGLAAAEGVEPRFRLPRPAELDGREVWLTSALHGIRVVSEWRGAPVSPGPATRAATWRARLDALARP